MIWQNAEKINPNFVKGPNPAFPFFGHMVQCICILPESRPTEGWRLESFLVALGVVFPMLVMMASGVILRKTGMADRPLVRRVDAINFHLFLPCLLFYNIYNVDLAQDFSVEVLAFAAAGLVLSLALSLLIVPRLVHRRDQVGVVVQAIVRSNFVMFGLAVTEYIYGEGNAGVAALLSAVVVPAMNVIAVLLLEYWRPEGSGRVSGPGPQPGLLLKDAGGIPAGRRPAPEEESGEHQVVQLVHDEDQGGAHAAGHGQPRRCQQQGQGAGNGGDHQQQCRQLHRAPRYG